MNVTDQIATPLSLTPAAPKEFVYSTTAPTPIVKTPMELFPLYNDKNPMLTIKHPEFDLSDSPVNIIDFANQLLHTMNHYGGAGLAAPQCGFPYRIFVMVGGIVCINPVIIESSKETSFGKEGCLSFPGLYLSTTRPATVRMRYTDEFGKQIEATWTGATARVAQHELNHLDGIVFTSLVGNLTLQMAKKKRDKMFTKIKRFVAAKEQHLRITGKDKTYGKTQSPTNLTYQNGPSTTTAVQSHREN
jgi:peptide deformylase